MKYIHTWTAVKNEYMYDKWSSQFNCKFSSCKYLPKRIARNTFLKYKFHTNELQLIFP